MNIATTTARSTSPAVFGMATAEGSQHIEARDGTPVLVRPIEPGDLEREREFVEGLSPRTAYQRLMSARKPSIEELQRWTRIDRSREGAVVATVTLDGRERQVGVARYAMDGTDGEAEIAIVIDDAWQGQGLGAHLMNALIDLARQSGVRRLVGSTLSENKGMLVLGRRLGFRLGREPGAAFVTMLSLTLQPES
jgi:acetyltransferase